MGDNIHPSNKNLLSMSMAELKTYGKYLCSLVNQGQTVSNEDVSFIYHRIFPGREKKINCRSCRISSCKEIEIQLEEEEKE